MVTSHSRLAHGCYATRRDLTRIARVGFWALLALIVFGLVLTFVNVPGGALAYSVLGLLIFLFFLLIFSGGREA